MRGDFPILDEELLGLKIPHATAAGMFTNIGRNARRTDARGIITMPMGIAINALRKQKASEELIERIAKAREKRISASQQTSMQIAPGRLAHDADLGIRRNRMVDKNQVLEARDDVVMTRLMDLHGVTAMALTAPGVDARWRMHARSAHPYVNYTGLPSTMPPFIMRPHWGGGDALVGIEFGQGVHYSNLGAFRMMQVEHPLPETIAIGLEGKRVTDVISHPALVDLVFTAPDEHSGQGAYGVEIDLRQSK